MKNTYRDGNNGKSLPQFYEGRTSPPKEKKERMTRQKKVNRLLLFLLLSLALSLSLLGIIIIWVTWETEHQEEKKKKTTYTQTVLAKRKGNEK